MFSGYAGINAIAAGTSKDAETVVSGDLIEWADAIFVMEKSHRDKIANRFREQLKGKKLAVLAIADNYEYMQPELVELLKSKLPRYISL